MKKLLLLLLCLPMIGFGQQTFNFMHNGLNREYIYYAPANLPVDAPLVFVAPSTTVGPIKDPSLAISTNLVA